MTSSWLPWQNLALRSGQLRAKLQVGDLSNVGRMAGHIRSPGAPFHGLDWLWESSKQMDPKDHTKLGRAPCVRSEIAHATSPISLTYRRYDFRLHRIHVSLIRRRLGSSVLSESNTIIMGILNLKPGRRLSSEAKNQNWALASCDILTRQSP
jgi:hypothetical protein